MNTPMELVRIAAEKLEAHAFQSMREIFPQLTEEQIEAYLRGHVELDEVLPFPANGI